MRPIEKLAVYTTVYPAAAPYLRAWSDSLGSQRCTDFTVVIASDGLPRDALTIPPNIEDVVWVEATERDTPVSLRQRAFELLARDFDACVFTDADDVLLPERVLNAREGLETADICGCALALIAEDGAELGYEVVYPEGVSIGELLPRSNVFGLSNTAWRAGALRHILPLPESVLLDWYMVTLAWISGASIRFDPRVGMLYRQYQDNTARLLPPFEARHLQVATRRILHHYALLLNVLPEDSNYREVFLQRVAEVESFEQAMNNKTRAARYLAELNTRPPTLLWWAFVAHPELETLWNA